MLLDSCPQILPALFADSAYLLLQRPAPRTRAQPPSQDRQEISQQTFFEAESARCEHSVRKVPEVRPANESVSSVAGSAADALKPG